jgi:hypothetical protein
VQAIQTVTGAAINALMRELADELAEEGNPNPLTQPLPLGFVWADLCRLAGAEPPADVAALLDEPVRLRNAA